jgi:cysteine desulfurase
MRRIYLDHATTTPPAPEVLQAMLPHLGGRFGNPSSTHSRGEAARGAIAEARATVAELLRAPAEEILFTGSATEANNLAIKGMVLAAGRPDGHIVAAATEHVSVLHPLRTLQKRGLRVTLVPVDRDGRVDAGALHTALRADALLVCVAHASAEIGTLQPIIDLCRVAHERGVPVLCDATATAGRIPWPAEGPRPDLVALAPHLFYGPQGVGALRIRQGVRLAPQVEGGTQEGGLRGGTESVAAIAGFGAAARLAIRQMEARGRRERERAERLRRRVLEHIPGMVFTGHATERVPGHVSLCVPGVEAEALLRVLDEQGIEAASGSACTTEAGKASHVLAALGLDPVLARGALTFSFGETNRDEDVETAAGALAAAVARLRSMSPMAS